MITAHKVLAAYACLAPRVVTGQFDPTRHRAIWPSTGNYARGGIAISRIMASRGVAILPEGMSQERFDWLEPLVREPRRGRDPDLRHRVERQGDLRRLQRARQGPRQLRPQPVLRVRQPPRPLRGDRARPRARLRDGAGRAADATCASRRSPRPPGPPAPSRPATGSRTSTAPRSSPSRRSSARRCSRTATASTTSRASATSTSRSSTT